MNLRFDLFPPDLLAAQEAFESLLAQANDLEELKRLKGIYVGRKEESWVSQMTSLLKQAPSAQKSELGLTINTLKKTWESALDAKMQHLPQKTKRESQITLGTVATEGRGSLHPIQRIEYQIVSIFKKLGYQVEEGPEIETEEHNFDGLNIHPDHPARRSSDTFYLSGNERHLLRTHTSPVQVRVLKAMGAPTATHPSMLDMLGGIKFLSPGRVYRKDEIDPTHSPMFHQIEGMLIGKNIGLQDLKGTLDHAMKALFGDQTQVRFRPGYFPFVEPGCEVDVRCPLCSGSGCRVCKSSGWIEILGAGLVHPAVLRHANIDPSIWSGFAFGLGIERIAMIISECPDLRLFFENDLRFLQAMRGNS